MGAVARFAVVVSRFNPEVTAGLLDGARTAFAEAGVAMREADVFSAPGTFELPLISQGLARTGRYSGVVCLGCVIKGETAHFEYISAAASMGLMQAALSTGVPVAFGMLATYTDAQALARSRPDAMNKGREAAAACLDAARLLRDIATDEG